MDKIALSLCPHVTTAPKSSSLLDTLGNAVGYWLSHMSGKQALALAVLTLWVLLGPLAMAFDGCLLMGTMCDGGPCANASSAVFAPAPLIGLEPIGLLALPPSPGLPPNSFASLEPPPKSSHLPA